MDTQLRKITRIGVYGVALKDHKILLVLKKDACYGGMLDLPGGGIEFGETPEETLKREFQEEVGLSFENSQLMTNISHRCDILHVKNPFSFHHLGQIYRVSEFSPIDVKPEEIFDWYPLLTLHQQKLAPFATKALQFLFSFSK